MAAHTDRNVTAKQLAFLLNGITERRVQQLAAEGIIKKEARGRYNLVESVRGYIAYLQDTNAGMEPHAESAYGDARTQKMRADADRAIMEAAQLAGSLVPTDAVEFQWNHMVGAVRQKLLNLPKKTAPLVQHEHTFAKCRSALTTAVHECLAELSDYRPPASHDRGLLTVVNGTATRANSQRVGGRKKKAVKRKQR